MTLPTPLAAACLCIQLSLRPQSEVLPSNITYHTDNLLASTHQKTLIYKRGTEMFSFIQSNQPEDKGEDECLEATHQL